MNLKVFLESWRKRLAARKQQEDLRSIFSTARGCLARVDLAHRGRRDGLAARRNGRRGVEPEVESVPVGELILQVMGWLQLPVRPVEVVVRPGIW